jgi:hypothetical protein
MESALYEPVNLKTALETPFAELSIADASYLLARHLSPVG